MRRGTVHGDRFNVRGRVVEEIEFTLSYHDGNVVYLHAQGENKAQHFSMKADELKKVVERLFS